jgi:hypothetical protein
MDKEFWYGHDCCVCGKHCTEHAPSPTTFNLDGTVNELCFECIAKEKSGPSYWFDVTSVEAVPSGDGSVIMTEPVELRDPGTSLPGFLSHRREEFRKEGQEVEFIVVDRHHDVEEHECRLDYILYLYGKPTDRPVWGYLPTITKKLVSSLREETPSVAEGEWLEDFFQRVLTPLEYRKVSQLDKELGLEGARQWLVGLFGEAGHFTVAEALKKVPL